MKFYHCKRCGNIVQYIENQGPPIVCCGEKMEEMTVGTVDASREKHVPVVEATGSAVKVTIGSQPHPMVVEHYIGWVTLETTQGSQHKELDHTGAPEVTFALAEGDKPVAAYAYCNLHGLWKSK